MKIATGLVLSSAMLFTGSALASAGLAAQHRCITCHSMDKKMVGPTWTEIAARNKGQANAERTLIEAITKGARGKYGKVPMPPQPRAAADAAALAKWILSL